MGTPAAVVELSTVDSDVSPGISLDGLGDPRVDGFINLVPDGLELNFEPTVTSTVVTLHDYNHNDKLDTADFVLDF